MSGPGLVLCLCVALGGGAPPERWVGEDKLKHFLASFAATTLAASAARTAGLERERSLWAGAGAAAGLGVWKEVRDLRSETGRASVLDLAWDLAGIGAAVAVVREAR